VGIGTTAPAANSKLHVDGSGAAGVPYGIYATSRTGTTSVNTHGIFADGSWRGVYGTNLSTDVRNRSIGVQGVAGGTNYSVEGVGVWAEANGTGSGTANNYGLYATASAAAGTNYSAWLNGQVRITDGTQGAGKVLTSDASGNASWQGPVGIRLTNLSSSINIPFAYTPITQWQTVSYEDGGSNYNSVTGEYTVPVGGVYSLTSNLGFFSVGANGYSSLLFFVNGVQIIDSRESAVAGTFPGTKADITTRLNAGDKVNVVSYSSGATFNCININNFCNWSVTLINR
jgi:hypothetical protein